MVISVLTVMNVSSVSAAETFYASLSAADVTTGTYTSETKIDDYFSIMASSSSTVSVDSSGSKSFTTADGTSYSMKNRIKTGGAGSTSARSIKVSPTKDGTLYVYATSSNNDDTRTLNLLDSEGSTVDYNDSVVPSSITEVAFDVEAGETYYVASASGGINFYYFGLVEKAATTTTYNTVTISGAPTGYVVGQGTEIIDATDTDTYSLAVGSSYAVWVNGYTPCYFTVASDTETVDASGMTKSNVYFDYFSDGGLGDSSSIYYTYDYTSDLWSLMDEEDGSYIGTLYFGLNNGTGLATANISGVFTLSTANNSWSPIQFKISDGAVTSETFAIRTVKDTGYALYLNSEVSPVATGLMHEANTAVSYDLTIDFEAGTATLVLDNDSNYTATIDIGEGYSQLDSIFGYTAKAARNIYMTTPEASFTYSTTEEYVYFGVSAENAANYSSFYIVDENKTKIEGSEGNEVYTGVNINGVETEAAELDIQGTGGSGYVVAYIVNVTSGNDISKLDIAFVE